MLNLNKIKFWWFRRRNDIPHPREINPFKVERIYLRELAKMYSAGFTLEQCQILIKNMACPEAPTLTRKDGSTYKKLWLQEKQFYGRELTRERLRRLIWKIWRDQRVDRNVR